MRHDVVHDLVKRHIPENAYAEQWDIEGLKTEISGTTGLDLAIADWAKEEGIANEEVEHRISAAADAVMDDKKERFGVETMAYIEKAVLLQTLDQLWRDHLVTLDHLRQVIGFRGYAQRDPLNEYRTEAFALFEAMLTNLRKAVTGQLMRVELVREQPTPAPTMPTQLTAVHADASAQSTAFDMAEAALFGNGAALAASVGAAPMLAEGVDPNDESTWTRSNRNGPCPCGSGKKYKHCHGKLA
jgi:preprotein translocase subunit SecA